MNMVVVGTLKFWRFFVNLSFQPSQFRLPEDSFEKNQLQPLFSYFTLTEKNLEKKSQWKSHKQIFKREPKVLDFFIAIASN